MSAVVKMFGICIDRLSRIEAVQRVANWLQEELRPCRYVVTPNVDHLVKLDSSECFRDAYAGAALVLADGRPVIAASKFFDDPLPETVPGSDLVPWLFDHVASAWSRPLTVFLLGAAPGVAERAAESIHSKWANVCVVGTFSPPFGFERSTSECAEICDRIARSGAELLVIGLGAPKQELWVARYANSLPVKVALCVGATIDFLAGEKQRAPGWVQSLGLEWFHRMASEPRRLAGRYAHDAFVFPKLLFREWRTRRSASN